MQIFGLLGPTTCIGTVDHHQRGSQNVTSNAAIVTPSCTRLLATPPSRVFMTRSCTSFGSVHDRVVHRYMHCVHAAESHQVVIPLVQDAGCMHVHSRRYC